MRTWPFAAAVLLAGAASAQDIRLTPLVDARLRWEQVDQTDLSRDAEALTARIRSGFAADAGPLQALVEAEATLAIAARYNSGTNGRVRFPLVPDPQNIELNRAQLRYAAGGWAMTAGRQRIELADQRFVGSANWRQNQQTFDAARIQWGDPARLFTDVTYAWSVRTVNGIEGAGARPAAIGGDNVFMLAGVRLPPGMLTGFAYLVDQDEAAVQAYALSSQTFGLRLVDSRPLGPARIGYAATVARQSDWHRNPNRYDATYWLAEATASLGRFALTAGQEVLGADHGRPLTSVQTPLASLFRFQGWAGKFATTPANGLRDLYATGGVTWKRAGPFADVAMQATWHRFRSDRMDQRYGREWDLLAGAKRGRTALSARFARYRSDGFAGDTDKLWLEADWTL